MVTYKHADAKSVKNGNLLYPDVTHLRHPAIPQRRSCYNADREDCRLCRLQVVQGIGYAFCARSDRATVGHIENAAQVLRLKTT